MWVEPEEDRPCPMVPCRECYLATCTATVVEAKKMQHIDQIKMSYYTDMVDGIPGKSEERIHRVSRGGHGEVIDRMLG